METEFSREELKLDGVICTHIRSYSEIMTWLFKCSNQSDLMELVSIEIS